MDLPLTPLPLFAREQELAFLALSQDSLPRLHLITGGPGIGKSRLLEDFIEQAMANGVATVVARCYDSSPPISFFPLLRAIELVSPGEALDRGLAGSGVANPAAIHQSNIGDARLGLFYAIRGRLEEVCRTRPLLLAIDDVQWADVDTLLLLNYLADQRLERLRIILTARTASAESSTQPHIQSLAEKGSTLELQGLPRAGSGQIANAILGTLRPHEVDFCMNSLVVTRSSSPRWRPASFPQVCSTSGASRRQCNG